MWQTCMASYCIGIDEWAPLGIVLCLDDGSDVDLMEDRLGIRFLSRERAEHCRRRRRFAFWCGWPSIADCEAGLTGTEARAGAGALRGPRVARVSSSREVVHCGVRFRGGREDSSFCSVSTEKLSLVGAEPPEDYRLRGSPENGSCVSPSSPGWR